MLKSLFLLLFIPFIYFFSIEVVKAETFDSYLANCGYMIVLPFKKNLYVGTICQRDGSNIDIIATKDACIPNLEADISKELIPQTFKTKEGSVDFVAGLNEKIIKVDVHSILELAGATEFYLGSVEFETETVSLDDLTKHMANMPDDFCYMYLRDSQVIKSVIKTRKINIVFKNAKSGGIEIVADKLAEVAIKGTKSGYEQISFESESPWYIGYKAYKGDELLKWINEKRKKEGKHPKKIKNKGILEIFGDIIRFPRQTDNDIKCKTCHPGEKYSKSKETPFQLMHPLEIEQDEVSRKHFKLWK